MGYAKGVSMVLMGGMGDKCTQIHHLTHPEKAEMESKKAQRIGERHNSELRLGWRADMLQFTAEQLVFVDDSLFNETTGW